MGWLDPMFGVIYADGEEQEVLGGLNFIGFTITADAENGRHNIAIAGAATTSDSVSNESSVTGTTVTAALNTLLSSVSTNTANIATNTASIAALATSLTTGTINVGTGTVGSGGEFNVDASFSAYGKNTGSGSSRLIGWGGADISIGDNTWSGANGLYLDFGLTGFAQFRNNGNNLVSLTRAKGWLWTYRSIANGGIVAVKAVAEDGSTEVNVMRWNVTAADELALGDTAKASVWTHVKASTGAFGVWDGTSQLMKVTPAGTIFAGSGGVLTGLTSINGASVVAPTQGTSITTTTTVQQGNGVEYDVSSAGGAYAITLGTTGVADGDMFILRAANALANAVTVTNGGTGGGNLGPSGVMTAGVKATYYYYYDGTTTAWKYSGRIRCA